MKLLFDANLSARLVEIVSDLLPDSIHVRHVGLERSSDEEIWRHAQTHGLTIVSKDSDFQAFSVVHGHPPKVVWIRRGNCSTMTIANLLRENHAILESFDADESLGLLILV